MLSKQNDRPRAGDLSSYEQTLMYRFLANDFEDSCSCQLPLRKISEGEPAQNYVNQMLYLCDMVNAEQEDEKRVRYLA